MSRLPAAYADFAVELLSRELEDSRKKGPENRLSIIMDILKPLRLSSWKKAAFPARGRERIKDRNSKRNTMKRA